MGSRNLLELLRSDFFPYLHSCRDPDALPKIMERLSALLGAEGVILWYVEAGELLPFVSRGGVGYQWPENHATSSAASEALRTGSPCLRRGTQRPYSEEDVGWSLDHALSFVVRGPASTVGCVELWWKSGQGASSVAEVLPQLETAMNETLPVLLAGEAERRNFTAAISRLMMLYDIGKVFHSTIELRDLGPLILSRVCNILEADAGAIWLLDPVKRNLYCAAATGRDGSGIEATRVWASDPGLGTTASQEEAVVLHNVEDPAWSARWGSPVHSLAAIPLLHDGRMLGAIEAVRDTGPYFTEEDVNLFIDVGKQAGVALRNAQRHQMERRVKEMNALMEISSEITATLNLDHVLTTAVNRITSVISADRCSLSLARRGRLEVSAISGEMKVNRKDVTVQELEAMHVWLAASGGDLAATMTDEGVACEREEAREKLARYFERSGMRALAALLLKDEEGDLGVMVLESKDPESLTHSDNDLARIFASQVTVAVRNALLYQQVPLIGVLQPLVQRKAKFLALPSGRRRSMIVGVLAVLAFLVFFPWWSKTGGEVRVLPSRIYPVSAEVQGVVQTVLVQEGDRIQAGQTLAVLAPDEQRVALGRAQAQHDILNRRVLQLEAEGNLGEARLERARLQQASAEVELHRARLAQTVLLSPIAGVMITPRLEEHVGQLLRRGEVFCQVIDMDHAWVELAVPEADVHEVQPGQEAWLKLNTFPDRKIVGHVIRVSPQGREQDKEQVFDVVVEVPNEGNLLRAGMRGRGKILTHQSSIGYLMVRAPARWLWPKLWNWLP